MSRRAFYEIYRRNTERLHQLVESLFDFARMEADRKPYHLVPIDAATFATDVVTDFQRQLGPHGQPVAIDCGGFCSTGLRPGTWDWRVPTTSPQADRLSRANA